MSEESAKPALSGEPEKVGQHYDQIWQMEASRLEIWCPVEYGITRRYLQRYIPDGAIVAEVGVGAGHYSERLAHRGCTLHLVDVSQKLLEAAVLRLREHNLADRVATVTLGSATDLSFLPSDSMDVVLFLGPLYHLGELSERQEAVNEAARILKPRGLIFAVGINRLSYLRDMFRQFDIPGAEGIIGPMQELFRQELRGKKWVTQYLATGKLDPQHAPPIGYAHMTTVSEFVQLFARDFERVTLVGLEAFTSPAPNELNDKPPEERELWLDLVERIGATPEGVAYSDHFLFIGRKM